MKKLGLIVMALFLTTPALPIKQALAQEIDSKLESFSSQAMNKIKNADFDNLFSDFYIPKENTARDTQNDKEAIISMFKELQNKLGVLENFSSINSVTEKLLTMDIITGSPQTTGIIPATNLFYKTKFAQFGESYVAVGVYRSGEKLFIKNITIGLPLANQNSTEIMKEVGMFMMNIAAEQQKRDAESRVK